MEGPPGTEKDRGDHLALLFSLTQGQSWHDLLYTGKGTLDPLEGRQRKWSPLPCHCVACLSTPRTPPRGPHPGQPQAQHHPLPKHSTYLPPPFKGLSSLDPLGSFPVTKETMMSCGRVGPQVPPTTP